MAFVKIDNSVVTLKSFIDRKGFIEAPDWVVCGFIQTESGFVAPPPRPPTKDQQIADLLAVKGVTRLLVQLTIEVSEDKAKALAASYGMTAEQALAYAYSKNKTYRECKDLETAIRAIEVAL